MATRAVERRGLRDTLLADPEAAYDHELAFLAELIEQIGPRSALAAVKRELEQRAEEATEH